MAVELVTVGEDDCGQRLDRWLKRRHPGLTQGRLQKLLRTGQIKVDGRKVKDAGFRIEQGNEIRIPPIDDRPPMPSSGDAPAVAISDRDRDEITASVLYRDDDVLVINKPAGLAVQGGSKTVHHLDGMLDVLKFDAAERPRLVHRLDKDTSGVLVLARNRPAAAFLTRAFNTREVRKVYWAVVAGVPAKASGTIDLPLSKRPSAGGEKVWVDEFSGKRALTDYRLVEKAGKSAAWMQLEPLTGRTHQLRVHMAVLKTPILGDGKYGGPDAFIGGMDKGTRLHLHARAISFPLPSGGTASVSAPLPPHMAETFGHLGFDVSAAPETFLD